MYHKFTEQNYPDLNVVVKEYSEGYHKNTVYRVIFAMLFLPPITLPFYTCKKILTCLYIAQTKQIQTQLFKNYFEFALS